MAITILSESDVKLGNFRLGLKRLQSSADPEVIPVPLDDVAHVFVQNETDSVGTISVSGGSVVVKGHGATDILNIFAIGL